MQHRAEIPELSISMRAAKPILCILIAGAAISVAVLAVEFCTKHIIHILKQANGRF
jgi:hypothetical protein